MVSLKLSFGDQLLIYGAIAFVAFILISLLIEFIKDTKSTHKKNKAELENLIKSLSENDISNIRGMELSLKTLKKEPFLVRPSKKRLELCQTIISPYIVKFIQDYANEVEQLKDLVDRQDVNGADMLLEKIRNEQNNVPEYCKLYDNKVNKYADIISNYKSIQKSFDENIKNLQRIVDKGDVVFAWNNASYIIDKLQQLLSDNPTYKHFDTQLLSELKNELSIQYFSTPRDDLYI